MIALAMLIAMGFQAGPAVDSVAVYSAILSQVRSEYPGQEITLSETRSGVECMPHCGAMLRDPGGVAPEPAVGPAPVNHSPGLLRALRQRRRIEATCAVRPDDFGCSEQPRRLFVALGEISSAPRRGPAPVEGGVWVQVAFLVPDACGTGTRAAESSFPDAFGYWYLLRQNDDGAWIVIQRAPWFAV
jgi:hypothetical protein